MIKYIYIYIHTLHISHICIYIYIYIYIYICLSRPAAGLGTTPIELVLMTSWMRGSFGHASHIWDPLSLYLSISLAKQ